MEARPTVAPEERDARTHETEGNSFCPLTVICRSNFVKNIFINAHLCNRYSL